MVSVANNSLYYRIGVLKLTIFVRERLVMRINRAARQHIELCLSFRRDVIKKVVYSSVRRLQGPSKTAA